jgi:hypothetical protein
MDPRLREDEEEKNFFQSAQEKIKIHYHFFLLSQTCYAYQSIHCSFREIRSFGKA